MGFFLRENVTVSVLYMDRTMNIPFLLSFHLNPSFPFVRFTGTTFDTKSYQEVRFSLTKHLLNDTLSGIVYRTFAIVSSFLFTNL